MGRSVTLLTPRDPAPSGQSPTFSVVVPVLNGGARLVELGKALAAQDGAVEVLLADSGSTDGAFEAAAATCAARRFDVAPGRYDHGLVRTALVRAARAPLVAILSQDAVPQGSAYLSRLAVPFREDARVAGAHARQIPRAGADPLVRASLDRWTPPGDRPVVRVLPPGGASLPPRERMRLARFDNVASMVRRDDVLERPFPSREFGEDLSWGWATLLAGRALAYAPRAVVEHSHEPTLREVHDRNVLSHRQARAEFGLRAVPGLTAGVIALLAGVPDDLMDGGPRWAAKGVPRRAAALLGQWRGGRG